MKNIVLFLLFCCSVSLFAQCPGPAQRTALINLQKSISVEGTLAGQIPLTDVCGNQRYQQYVEVNLTPIGYTPTSTGNTDNLSEFVTDPGSDIWYIDWQGNAVPLSGGGGSFSLFANEGVTRSGTDTVQLGSRYTNGGALAHNIYGHRTVMTRTPGGAWGAIVFNDLLEGGPIRLVVAADSVALRNAIDGAGTYYGEFTVLANGTHSLCYDTGGNTDVSATGSLFSVINTPTGGGNAAIRIGSDTLTLKAEGSSGSCNNFRMDKDSTRANRRIVYTGVDTITFTNNTLVTKKWVVDRIATAAGAGVYVAGPITGSGTSLFPLNILNESLDSSRYKNGAISRKDITPAPGLSVMARDSNSTGFLKYLTAGSDFQVFRRSGSLVGFGSINLASSNAVGTSLLSTRNGGTGVDQGTNPSKFGTLLVMDPGIGPMWEVPDVALGNVLISGGVSQTPSYGKVGLTTHVSGVLPVANGGTNINSYTVGAIPYASASGVISQLADVATGNVIISGGVTTAPSYGKVGLTTHVSGVLPVANGGTNASSAGIAAFNNIAGTSTAGFTGTTSTNLVFSTSPVLVTPNLGTPSAITLTNGTNLPISTGVSGLGTNVATFLGTPSSANLGAAVTDETGTGALVFATSPTLTTPNLGTPSAVTLTNGTSLPLATGVSGVLPYPNGGTGLSTLGTAGQSLRVNTGATALEYYTPSGGGGGVATVTGPGVDNTDAANPVVNARPYKVYTALLSQSGSSDPTAIVLENSLGGSVVWTYSSTGIYDGTLTGAFTTDKTVVFMGSFIDPDGYGNTASGFGNVNVNFVEVRTQPFQSNVDGVLNGTPIEIRVYP